MLLNIDVVRTSRCMSRPTLILLIMTLDVRGEAVIIFPDTNSSFINLQELKESFNYGLFCPPINGKAGKFLDEERRLGDYPFNGPIGYLEVSFYFIYE